MTPPTTLVDCIVDLIRKQYNYLNSHTVQYHYCVGGGMPPPYVELIQ